ncbi:hypothetical protein GZH49_07500 [Nocardia terpenica]|uniref:hypothetical protein n=1 Tax=Nocardia terpenica TaxID=455432 RepID=UPI002FE166A7
MLNTGYAANGPNVLDPRAGLLDPRTAAVSFGYYAENATEDETIRLCHNGSRPGPTGWWNRHRRIRTGVGFALVANIGFLPAVQDALMSALHALA